MITTSITKQMICPIWKEAISIEAKYYYPDETNCSARLVQVICPIKQNLSLPASKRNDIFMRFPYCDMENCQCLEKNNLSILERLLM